MGTVEFVSYDGAWPALCLGTLVIKVDGKEYQLRGLCSGGSCGFSDDYVESFITKGPWSISLYEYPELEPYREEIEMVINENVEQGCCGGCL